MQSLRRIWLASLAVALALMAPRAALAQRTVQVNIDSNPQGATVRVDSETATPLGTTPLRRARIPRGPHTLFISRPGYITEQMQVNVARRNETFTATLTQAGSIYVSADIAGAQILLNGNGIGTTPGRIDNLRPGQYVVEITQPGMQTYRETVTVTPGGLATVNANLRPPPPQAPPTGIVRVIVTNPNGPLPGDLQVTFDGVPMTGTPPSVEQAQPGQHIVQVSAGGFRTVRREVTVTAGQTIALAVDLEAIQQAPTGGSVRVLVPTPGAQVFLDGELLQGTPPQATNVAPGTHTLRVTAPGRVEVRREIGVTAGQTTVTEIPDLAVVPQVGRINVSSPTPGAQAFIDGRACEMPCSQEVPAGSHQVIVRAQGFDERRQTCVVAVGGPPCEVNLELQRTIGRGVLHVELARAIRGSARVLVDGEDRGEVGAGRDVPNLTAGVHELRVQAPGYQDYVESVTITEGGTARVAVTMRRERRGPTGAELAMRRTAISTFSASPLAQRDAALDLVAGLFAYPAELRGTTGLLPYGPLGLDAGFSVRSLGWLWEIEVRSRLGYRVADGLLAFGAELRGYAGFGTTSNFGFSARALLSLHSTAPTSDQEEENIDDPNERSNRPGNFAFTLHLGFEALQDGLAGLRATRDNGTLPRIGDNTTEGRMQFDEFCRNMGSTCPTRAGTSMNDMERYFTDGSVQNLVRPLVGATFEISISRHANLFVQVERIMSGATSQRRFFYAITWFGNDPLTYVRAGLTYKF